MPDKNSNRAAPFNATSFLPFLLSVVALVAYANTFDTPFVFDSKAAILENPHVKTLWPITEAMKAPWLGPLAGRPVAALTFALNYAISGYSTWSYHATNLIIHLLAALTLYAIIRLTLSGPRLSARFEKHATALAFTIAAIWLVHPLQTESVTYVVQRSESLMALFYLLTLYCAIRAMHSAEPAARWYILSTASCALGMATKEVMATAPLLVLLYDRTFVASSFRSALRRRWPLYLALAATWAVLIALMLPGPRASSTGFAMQNLTAVTYAKSQFGVITHYLKLAFWPRNLCLDYSWQVPESWNQILGPMLLIVSLLGLTFYGFVRNRAWAYAGVWFFVILAPTSTLVPIADLAFEHRMYLPLAGLTTLVVLAVYRLLEKFERFDAATAAPVISIIIIALTLATLDRNRDYQTEQAIWQAAVDVRPDNRRARYNLAQVLNKKAQYDRALTHLKHALELKPNDPDALTAIADNLKALGKFTQAVDYYQKAINADPNAAVAHTNLGNLYFNRNLIPEAVRYHTKAVELDPDDSDKHFNLAVALHTKADFPAAERHYRAALELNPEDPDIASNLGFVLQRQGKTDQAIQYFRTAIGLDPKYADAHNNLALALYSQKKPTEAIDHFRCALQIDPTFFEAAGNLAITYAGLDRFDLAGVIATAALDFSTADPNSPLAGRLQKLIADAEKKRKKTPTTRTITTQIYIGPKKP